MTASNLLKVEAEYYIVLFIWMSVYKMSVWQFNPVLLKMKWNVFQSYVTSPDSAALRVMERQTYSRDPRFYIGPEARVP
jgi:hypothetical protein